MVYPNGSGRSEKPNPSRSPRIARWPARTGWLLPEHRVHWYTSATGAYAGWRRWPSRCVPAWLPSMPLDGGRDVTARDTRRAVEHAEVAARHIGEVWIAADRVKEIRADV